MNIEQIEQINPKRISAAEFQDLKVQVRLAGFGDLANQMNSNPPRPSAGTTIILVVLGLALVWTVFVPILCIMTYFGSSGGAKQKHRTNLATEAKMMLLAKASQQE